ncbi:MAG: hypothetical protein J0G32_02760 [Alphaproteobacteria bacterium]|nr:hypothetical protein [Alphaproteobacteria bacterium]
MAISFTYNDKILSDHLPQVMDTPDFGKIMTWNVLMQCNFFEDSQTGVKFFNNGSKVLESDEEYYARVDLLTDVLQNVVSSDNINVICLQEFPKMTWDRESADYFINSINSKLSYVNDTHYSVYYSNNSDEITIYNSDTLKIEDSKFVENELNNILERNSNRFNVSMFKNLDGKSLALTNLHLKGFNPTDLAEEWISVNETTKIINKLEDLDTDHYVITGDFNYNIDKYKDYFQKEANNFDIATQVELETTLTAYHGNDDSAWLNTCDGFIYC